MTVKLLDWFYANKRDLPWRHDVRPYSVWISEIMLQQTVIRSVISYYKKWMKRFPDVHILAKAGEKEVLTMWEGLGYYSRARNILKCAHQLIGLYKGTIPDEYDKLIRLPGIGDYTASAILSIAYKKPYPVMDANVNRVARRILALKSWDLFIKKEVADLLKKIISSKDPGGFNEAVMELGQRVCLVDTPLCSQCPVSGHCVSYKKNLQDRIPEKKNLQIKSRETLLPILITENRKSILVFEKKRGVLQGLWMFPGISRTGGYAERMEQFIEKNISDDFEKHGKLTVRTHHYTRFAEKLFPFIYSVRKPGKKLKEDWMWIPFRELEKYPFPSVYRRILQDVEEYMKNL